ncbi:MAG TPA: hypothetical protein VID75_02535 [Acidimicrobiales bacterium]|jgi:hypothetical protein
MTDSRTLERRFRLTDPMKPGSRLCRVCLEVIVLEPGFIETTIQHVYVRCPHCGGSFPVRHSDVQALRESQIRAV